MTTTIPKHAACTENCITIGMYKCKKDDHSDQRGDFGAYVMWSTLLFSQAFMRKKPQRVCFCDYVCMHIKVV